MTPFDEVVTRSGLTRTELAEIYGVTRQTMHHWRVTGLPKYNTHAGRMAEVITKTLLVAMQRRILPLAAMSKPARKARVASMAKTAQALKPAAQH